MHKNILLHLTLISGIGPATIALIVKNLSKEDFTCLYTYTIADFVRCGISYDRACKVVQGLQDMSVL